MSVKLGSVTLIQQVAGRIFGRMREDVAGGWRRLHNEELHLHKILLGWSNERGWDWQDMYHAWEKWEICTIFWLENLKGRDQSHDLGVGGRTISEFILGKYGGKVRNSSGLSSVAGSCGHGNAPSGSIQCGEFAYQPSDY